MPRHCSGVSWRQVVELFSSRPWRDVDGLDEGFLADMSPQEGISCIQKCDFREALSLPRSRTRPSHGGPVSGARDPVERWRCSVSQSRGRLHFASAAAEGAPSSFWRSGGRRAVEQADQADSPKGVAGLWSCPRANGSRQPRSQAIVVPSS